MNVVLTGMPGSGKSTVSKVLKREGKTVVDTDAEIVKEHGRIADIFAMHGEEYFRKLETQTVIKLAALKDTVIATGGGCILREQNVQAFKRGNCKIVYLRAGYETLLKRVSGNNERPLLAGDVAGKLQKLYAERTPVYEAAADVVIDTDGLTPEQVAQKITEYIK